MAKNKQTGISYREHEIKEDHSFGSIGGKTPGVHKRYFCKVVGRTVKGTLDEVKRNRLIQNPVAWTFLSEKLARQRRTVARL